MKWIRALFANEAVVASQAATAVIGLLTAFGIIEMTGEQTGAVLSLLVAAGVVLGRGFAWRETSADQVAADAYHLGRDAFRLGVQDDPPPTAEELWEAHKNGD